MMERSLGSACSKPSSSFVDVTPAGGAATNHQHPCGQLEGITQGEPSLCTLWSSSRGGVEWKLVWCHEWSKTPDTSELRQALSIHAKSMGARLVVLKKAKNFYDWATSNRNPYLLMTDWREVKHCFDVMDKIRRPILTAVFCINETQRQKAQCWASKLATRIDPVHIFVGRPSLQPLMPLLRQEEVDTLDGTDDKSFCDDLMTEPCLFQQLKPTYESVQLSADMLFQPWKVRSVPALGFQSGSSPTSFSSVSPSPARPGTHRTHVPDLMTVRRNMPFNGPWPDSCETHASYNHFSQSSDGRHGQRTSAATSNSNCYL